MRLRCMVALLGSADPKRGVKVVLGWETACQVLPLRSHYVSCPIRQFHAYGDGRLRQWLPRCNAPQDVVGSASFARQVPLVQELCGPAQKVLSHDLVVIEDLAITNMTRSARGMVGRLGWNVSAKSGLNRSIVEQSWTFSLLSSPTSLTGMGEHP